MANRPPFLCELDKGKLIDTQSGFVDTFNYAVRAIDNLKGGRNCTVDWTIDDHPVINVDIPENPEGGSGDYGKVVEDVTEDTQDDKDGLKIWYTDSTDSFIPFPTLSGSAPDAINEITRESGGGSYPYQDVLSCMHTQNPPTTVDLGITLSSGTGNSTNQATTFQLSNMYDSNVKFSLGGNVVRIGVYYI